MSRHKKYVSVADRFLLHFDQQHARKSKSQREEIEAYQDLFYHRDVKNMKHTDNPLHVHDDTPIHSHDPLS